jgi:hypothetical protein
MDDRLAKLLLEDNILSIQKRDSARIALLEKLATIKSVDLQTLPIPGVTISPGSNQNNWQNVFLFDDFIGGNSASIPGSSGIVIGNLAWSQSANTVCVGSSGYGVKHPGVMAIGVTSPGYGVVFLSPSSAEAAAPLLVDGFELLQFVIYTDDAMLTNDFIFFGAVASSWETYGLTSEGVFFSRSESDTNWKTNTIDGDGVTTKDTGLPFSASTWFLFEIKKTLTGFDFYINQTLVSSHTTNVSTTQILLPFAGHYIDGSQNFYMDLDYFAMQLAHIVQRWD